MGRIGPKSSSERRGSPGLTKARILNETQSGGVTFNDCGLHIAARDVPFGGVGKERAVSKSASTMGRIGPKSSSERRGSPGLTPVTMVGANLGGKDNNPEYYTHIINDRNFERLDNLLQQTSGEVEVSSDHHRRLLRRSVGVDCQGARSCDR
jgi:hypothetical protein